MSRAVQITCDQCGKQKQETNHWFMAAPYRGGIFVQHSGGDMLSLEPIYDLCGEACVLKKVSEVITKQS